MIRFDMPGIELDLGGIAKGFAVDRAVGVLRENGITAAIVSSGMSRSTRWAPLRAKKAGKSRCATLSRNESRRT